MCKVENKPWWIILWLFNFVVYGVLIGCLFVIGIAAKERNENNKPIIFHEAGEIWENLCKMDRIFLVNFIFVLLALLCRLFGGFMMLIHMIIAAIGHKNDPCAMSFTGLNTLLGLSFIFLFISISLHFYHFIIIFFRIRFYAKVLERSEYESRKLITHVIFTFLLVAVSIMNTVVLIYCVAGPNK